MRISSSLLHGLKDDERKKYKEYLVHNKELLDRIVNIMRDERNQSVMTMAAVANYEKAAWPQYVADQLGYQRALAKMIGILTLDREENVSE